MISFLYFPCHVRPLWGGHVTKHRSSPLHRSSPPSYLPTLPHATFRSSGSERAGSTQPYNSDPLRRHPAPTALPQELHRCDRESPHSLHTRRRTHVSPRLSPSRNTCTRLPKLFRQERSAPVSPSFSRSKETSTSLPQLFPRKGDVLTSPPTFFLNPQSYTNRSGLVGFGLERMCRSGLVGLGLERTCRSGRVVLGLQRTCRASPSFLGLHELELAGSIMHLAAS